MIGVTAAAELTARPPDDLGSRRPARGGFLLAGSERPLGCFLLHSSFFFFSLPPYVAVSSELVFRTACEYGESVDA